jgi:hypothetical protein
VWVINPLLPIAGFLLDGRDRSLGLFLLIALVSSFAYVFFLGWLFGGFRTSAKRSAGRDGTEIK